MEIEKTQHDVMSYKTLVVVLCLLLVLTAVTVGVSRIDLGKLNIWAALLIASAKCSLVIFFFMNLKNESRAIKLSLVAALFCVAILIGFLFWDISFR